MRVKPKSLSEWASLAEVVASVAVVISLLFVGLSVRQNTDALQGATENLIFERHTDLSMQFMLDPTLAELLVKMRSDDPQLSAVEAVRWEKYQLNLLDIWALAFNRHESDLLADSEWAAWDGFFADVFSNQAEALSLERWNTMRFGYDPAFWAHVHASLFARAEP